jgi:hypothetical protein
MHNMWRGSVVGLTLRIQKILGSNRISQTFSHNSQPAQVTLIKRIFMNSEMLTSSAIRHREVI